MATFTGTKGDEIITPFFVSPTVTTTGGTLPTNAADLIEAGGGNDTIDGGGGDDTILAGSGNDVVTGGQGSDVALLGSGDDTFIWNPGDGSDLVEGQGGSDTLLFNGANVSENISISANGSRVMLTRDVGNVTMDINGIEHIQVTARGGADSLVVNDLSGTGVKDVSIDLGAQPGGGVGDGAADMVTVNGRDANDHITIMTDGTSIDVNGLPAQVMIAGAEGALDTLVVNGLGGNDVIDASALPAGQIQLQINGGEGNDKITGSHGADILNGGSGNDVVTGGTGNDVALLGDGDDTFIWNPGDGSDVVEGQTGTDTLVFNGSAAAETMFVGANGSRALLTRDVGNVTMDLNGVEHIQISAAGGADNLTIGDLTGTGVTQVAVDLAAMPGGSAGDGAADNVTVTGTAANDFVTIDKSAGAITVTGLPETVTITHAEGSLDHLTVLGGAGDDVIDASNLGANQIALTLNGGAGNDVISGSHGDDLVIGAQGNDTAFLGAGDDTFVWNPGDGSDVVDGGTGTDTMLFNGANVGEHIGISANGSHVLFSRDVAAINMNLTSIEHIDFNALGGSDNIVVGDLTGSGVKEVTLDLAGTPGGNTGDGQPDTVTVNGTAGNNQIDVTASAGTITVNGLAAQVIIENGESQDSLVINGGAGNDAINASTLPAGSMALTLAGGGGNDVLTGGAENDTFAFTFGEGGQDVVKGFQVHGVSLQGDTIGLAGFADHSFDQLVADGHIAQTGADVTISDGTHAVATLQNVQLSALHANDFLFS